MTDYTPATVGTMRRVISAIVPVGETVTLALPLHLSEYPRTFCGAEYFSDVDGTPTAATAGTAEVEAYSLTSPQVPETLAASTLDATAPGSVSWAVNTTKVVVTPTGITGATHWRINLTFNVS